MQAIWHYESPAVVHGREHVLPDGRFQIVIDLAAGKGAADLERRVYLCCALGFLCESACYDEPNENRSPFFVLAYLLAWVVMVPLVLLNGAPQFMMIAACGPAAAALITNRLATGHFGFWLSDCAINHQHTINYTLGTVPAEAMLSRVENGL